MNKQETLKQAERISLALDTEIRAIAQHNDTLPTDEQINLVGMYKVAYSLLWLIADIKQSV